MNIMKEARSLQLKNIPFENFVTLFNYYVFRSTKLEEGVYLLGA